MKSTEVSRERRLEGPRNLNDRDQGETNTKGTFT